MLILNAVIYIGITQVNTTDIGLCNNCGSTICWVFYFHIPLELSHRIWYHLLKTPAKSTNTKIRIIECLTWK